MGKNKTKSYGKPVQQYMGYNIRILLKEGKNPTGKYGIFAGKKMLQEAANIEGAIVEIDKIVNNS